MKCPLPSPLDAPMSFQADVQEFQILCRRLGIRFVYQPTRADSAPDTAIVTNQEILAMQAAAQQVLETMVVLGPFSWDGRALTYSAMGVELFQPAGNVVDALLALAGPVKETQTTESEGKPQ